MLTCSCASGVICTAEMLDREKTPHYWLSVLVTDLGTEPLLSWTHVFLEVLDINDNAPQLSQPVYFASVPENMDHISSFAQVSATDADASSEGKLAFRMLESHRTYFDVDPQTGETDSFIHSFKWYRHHSSISLGFWLLYLSLVSFLVETPVNG